MINIQGPKKFLSSLPAVNERSIWDGSRIQDAISGKLEMKKYIGAEHYNLFGILQLMSKLS